MTADTVGGVWTFALDLARELTAQGSEVLLASFGRMPSEAQTLDASRIRNLLLLPSACKLEWMDDPWHDVERSGRELMRLADEYSPGIVHLNSFGHGALPWRAPVVLTAHSCVLSWWKAVRGEPAPAGWNRYRDQVTRALASADVVTAPTAAMASTLKENYGFSAAACTVVPNGRDASQYRQAEKAQFILTAGRLWDEAKNVAAVAHAASSLPWPVYAAGDAKHPDGGTAHFSGCQMLGQLAPDAMADWLSRASIFALPARYEPFGLSPLEAGLSGCALVLGDIPTLREVWGDAAVFVQPDDGQALQKAIVKLIESPVLLREMSRRARARASQFSAGSMGRRYIEIYLAAALARQAQCVS